MADIAGGRKLSFLKSLFERVQDSTSPVELVELSTQVNEDIKKSAEKEEKVGFTALENKPLYKLYCIWMQCLGNKPISVTEFNKEMLRYCGLKEEGQWEERFTVQFMESVEKQAEQLLWVVEALLDGEEEGSNNDKPPIDYAIRVAVPINRMKALFFIIPPFFGGKTIETRVLLSQLAENKVVKEIDIALLKRITTEGLYFHVFTIARGALPIDGEDGKIIDCVQRVSQIDIKEDDKGVADFKNLNIFQSIKKGEAICEIILPSKGTDGFDVSGKVIAAKPGRPARVPGGKNTIISRDGKRLLAEIDGGVTFHKDKFRVENVLEIKGNVDNGVGNISFVGDVFITGDILSGFTVKVEGNVNVRGMVEGAYIYAGGDVLIEKGMNGNRQGLIEAGGDVRCKFLENTTVKSGGCIYSESILWSEVYSDDTVFVKTGKGVIIGGSISAAKCIEARLIGSKSNQKTSVALGYSQKMVEEQKNIQQELENVEAILDKLLKNVNFLKNRQVLAPEKQVVLDQLIQQEQLYMNHREELKRKDLIVKTQMSDFKSCTIKSGIIYPPARITIGSQVMNVESASYNCFVHLSDKGEIVVGTY